LAFARRVVDEMYTGVAARLDDQVQMDDYQREILEKALSFYERFALPQSRDPQVRLEAARAGLRVGAIRSRLGQTAVAEQADRQALEILSGLVSEHSADRGYREALAQAHQELGAVFRDEERWREAERELKAAAALWEALARERPAIVDYRPRLADVHKSLGFLYLDEPRPEEALTEYRLALDVAEQLARENPEASAYQALLAVILRGYGRLRQTQVDLPGSEAALERAAAILERLARIHPEVTRYQLDLGGALGSLGQTLGSEEKFVRAESAFQRSIAILERLVADHPQDLKIALALGYSYARLTMVLLHRGDGQSALEWSGRVIRLFRSLARRDPRNLDIARTQLWHALAGRAETLMRLGRHGEALADFEESLELTRDGKEYPLVQAFHALSKARLGDLSALALLGDQVRDTLKAGAGHKSTGYFYWMLCYDAACVHAALAKLALQDERRPPAERQRLAQRDLDRALDFLEMMREPGEFEGGGGLAEIRAERLLDPLRSHPRFRLLMMDLEFPDDPFRP
jgi:tetratricopeptide (TPR) repeat protein